MPTLVDDTIEFQASTLSDLFEAEARSVAAPSAGAGKYRSWAFLSTAAAGLLAILLVVSLVTDSGKSGGGGGGGGGGAKASAKTYPGTHGVPMNLSQTPGSDVVPDAVVAVFDKSGNRILEGIPVKRVVLPGKGNFDPPLVELALTDPQADIFSKAFPKGNEKGRVLAQTPGAATTPVPAAPAAATPDSTAPATPPPPAPAQTPPPSG